jgi:hypothetical protein
LSKAVLQATTNLSNVSLQLKELASSLSDTLSQHSQLIQSQIQESALARNSPNSLHIRAGASNMFSPYSVAPLPNEKVVSAKSSPERTNPGSPGLTKSPANLRQTIEQSRDTAQAALVDDIIDKEMRMSNQDISHLRDSLSKMSETMDDGSIDDEELASMIRSVMRQKLTSILSSEI